MPRAKAVFAAAGLVIAGATVGFVAALLRTRTLPEPRDERDGADLAAR